MTDPATINRVRELAVQLLVTFVDPAFAPLLPDMTAQLRPRPGDAARVFDPSIVQHVEQAYDRIWQLRPVITPNQGQTQVLVAACPARALGTPDVAATQFPGGFARIAHLLRPDRIWIAWKFVQPGKTSGMAYNGLVHLGDRFVWYPKPWAALGADAPDELRQN